jgi:hypothetical protein
LSNTFAAKEALGEEIRTKGSSEEDAVRNLMIVAYECVRRFEFTSDDVV